MMNDIVLDDLFPLQKELDEAIHKQHQVTYESTHYKRVLALLVELGEFSNETRCFKYWSEKAPSPKERILDEYADGLHFFLSLGIPIDVVKYTHKFKKDQNDLTLQILQTYVYVSDLLSHYDAKHYSIAFGSYLNLLPLLGFSGDDAIQSYRSKLAINFQRQKDHY
jgi:dimeric dUTPase (all-alpha-NTP-PPase superfamily)